MKKSLLLASLFISGATFAQFTQSNEPAIGDNRNFFVVDTLAPDYSSTTGTGVIWDYSSFGSLSDNGSAQTAAMNIVAAASTTYGSSFPSATKAVELEGAMTTYFTSTTTSRNSKGFVFDGSNVVSLDDSNDELLMNYPFANGASLSDNFTGTANVGGFNAPTTGTITATVDGSGTLKLNSSTILTGVLRYKIVENATANAGFFNITLTRTQYEYYQLSSGNLPVFVHSKVDISTGGAPTSQVMVLNSAQPDVVLSVGENILSGVTVYPNPAKDMIYVSGLQDAASVTLVDAQGKTIQTLSSAAGTASVNIEALKAGVYFMKISTEKGSKTERVVVR